MKKIVAYLFLLFISLQSFSQSLAVKIDTLLTAYAKDYKFNGTALVAYKGAIVLQKGYGFKDVEAKIPNDGNTIFQVGSLTKQITAAVIMQLNEEGKLSITDKLSKYYPAYPNGNKITIQHLLTHTSGIYNYTNDTTIMRQNVNKPHSEEQMLASFINKPLDFEPGTKWNYSNSGYSLLGYIIKKVTNKPYEQVVRERIFQPLQMNQSGFDFTHLNDPNKATGYFVTSNSLNVKAPIVDSTIAYAAGAIYSTVGDFYKWERAIKSDKLLKKDSWKTIFTPSLNKYGFGWFVDSLYNKQLMGHSGGIHGFSSYITRFAEDDLAIILLTNTSSPSLSSIWKSIAAIMYNQPYKLPTGRTEILLDTAVLQQYIGEYQFAPTFSITIFLDSNQLKAQATGQSAFDLFAEKEDFFFTRVVDAQIEFIKDDTGKVSEMILYQNGSKLRAKKIK
jgi:CubicO group peptidase (beta-lactamase class C family)